MRVVADVDDELADRRAEDLRADVRQDLTPREHTVDGLCKRHRRVDVRAGDTTEHQYGEHDTKAVAHGDVDPASVMPFRVFQFDIGHCAIAEDHQYRGADELRRQPRKQRVFHCSSAFSMRMQDGLNNLL